MGGVTHRQRSRSEWTLGSGSARVCAHRGELLVIAEHWAGVP